MPDLIQFEPEVSIDFEPEERTRDEKKAGYVQQKRELEEAARQGKGIENLISLAQIGLKAIAPLDVTGTATREMIRQGEQPLPPVISPQAFQNDVNTVVGFGAQGLRNLGIPIPTDIKQGISEFGAETLSSMTDPTAGAAMIAGGMAPKIAGPAIGRYFQAKMASEIPAAAEAAMQAETPSEQVKAGLGVASLAALPIAIQAHLNRANAIQIPPGIPSMGSTLEMPRGARAPRIEPVPIERLTGADLVRMNEQMNREAGIDFEPEKGTANAESIRASEGQLPQTRVEPQGIQEAGGNVVEQKPPGQSEPVVQGGQPQAQSEVLLTPEAKPSLSDQGTAPEAPAPSAAVGESGTGVVEQPATQPPAIPTDKPNLTETQVAPSEVATQATPIRPGPGASTMADVGAESAAQSAGIRTAEFVNETAKTPDIPVKGPEPVVEADLQSVDPKVEQRWQDAKIAKQTILQKGLAAIGRARDAMTRHFRWLDPKTDGVEIDILRRHENVPVFSKYLASQVLRGVTATLSPRKYDVFSRIVILRDLAKYAEKYGEQLEELPFGYPSLDAIKTDLARFEQTAQKFPDIAQAVQRRDAFMDALRYDLVSRGLLPEQVKDFGEYFHHQVLEYMAMKESGPVASTGAYDVRTHKKGWQRKRTGSEKDYNTSYLESEFEVISQAFSQMLTQDTLKELRGSDILPDLKAEAKAQGADWQSLIPKDYTIWQPQKGNHFYWANSIADKALESYFRGERSLTEKDVKEILAMGGPKEQWVIPKRLAKTLNDWGPQVDHPIEKFIGAGQSQWKRWTLFNPMRNLIYELNNFSGDADIAFAVDPKIFKFAPEAAKVLREFVLKKKAGTQEINELIKLGVIDSGFSVQELPDLKGNQFFKALEGKDPSIVSKYWNTVLDFNRWREGILRYAAYQRALQKLQAGEKPYWTSKRTEMDALYSDPRVTQQQIAAKLAREAIGDYGNISVAGQWIRSKMIPFYAWMEINAPRYVRLFQNLPYEGEGRGRLAGVAAKKVAVGGAKLAARAGALYILANIWNKTFFPQEEKELADTRDQFHIILGRNEDGSVRSLRFQGALSDALSWFGGEDVIGDVEAVKRGTATVGEKLTEAAKSPINKLLNASFPIQKTLTEALFQKTTFPDVFNPRLVRDPGAHLARLVSMGTIYNYLTSKPQRTGTWSPLSLVTYTTDPGEAAYYTAKSLVSKYLEDQQKERPGSEPTRRGNALYYYKQAIKYKDEKTAEYWKQKYFELGGKPAGMQTSIRNSSPFYGVKRNPFMETLTPSEQAIMLRAEQWYKRTYLNH